MHFEILVEDVSGKVALEILLPRIVGEGTTYRIHSYRGVGHIPRGLKDPKDASKRILLDNLPKLLRGFGKTFAGVVGGPPSSVIVVCDLDDRDRNAFLRELNDVLLSCTSAPETRFCLAIEEGEAWLLGDIPAVISAFPRAKRDVLSAYINDSICGTWERLADAVFPGGRNALERLGGKAVGIEKSNWAQRIPVEMQVDENRSPSFCAFRDTVRTLAGE